MSLGYNYNMNINPQAKVVLCYGDSNTWGQNDDKNVAGRYAADVRWTGSLQKHLGDDYYVIEEGLGGRTTDLEHYNPDKPSRNGFTYFKPCLTSHSPLSLVVIMLGTNDLKLQYQRPVGDIANALKVYVDTVKAELPNASVLLIGPIYVDDTAPKFTEYYDGTYDGQSALRSKELGQAISQLADETGCTFFDASTVARAGKDGIHFDMQSHAELAKSLSELVQKQYA